MEGFQKKKSFGFILCIYPPKRTQEGIWEAWRRSWKQDSSNANKFLQRSKQHANLLASASTNASSFLVPFC